MDYQAAIDGLKAWVPDPQARQRIGGETAFRLYFA